LCYNVYEVGAVAEVAIVKLELAGSCGSELENWSLEGDLGPTLELVFIKMVQTTSVETG
jgi:hypothetical protein